MAKRELILLALDESQILRLMERALTATGYDVAIALDVDALKRELNEASPSLVVIGEKFSKQKGVDLSIEMLDRFPTLPILLYAEKDTTGIVKAVLKASISGYLYPPLKTDDIVDAVKRSLKRAGHLGDWIRREVKKTTSSLAQKAKFSEAERAKLEAIFASIQDGIIVLDKTKRIQFINHTVCTMFGLDKETAIGMLATDTIPHLELNALLERANSNPLKYQEINLDDGQVFNTQVTPITNIGYAITMQDITYLKELNRVKNEFVHTVSHDLRSPLTAILGYTGLISRSGNLSEQQEEFLQRIQQSVQHITTLVNDLLDLERHEAGFDTRRETVQIENVLKHTLDQFETLSAKKKQTMLVNVDSPLPPLRANPIRIRQMLDNLIGNAIKYTPANGTIKVELHSEAQQIILEVADSGQGIPPSEHSRIFEKFYRASNVTDDAVGTGLGLAIVKSIVDSHGGRVWVESAVGEGARFFVVLPAHE